MRGRNFTPYMKMKALKMWLEDKIDPYKVCIKIKCGLRSLYNWRAIYDGTIESLANKSCRPHTPHPNAHTEGEKRIIFDLFRKHPDMPYCIAYGILREKYAYSRTYCGFYRFLRKANFRPVQVLEKYVPKPYDTPEMFGYKWQMDVKYVPVKCYKGEIIHEGDNKFYQYTMIDETTRERFLFPYKEHTVTSTLDFVKRAIVYFGYAPEIVQTDNGAEFTNIKKKKKKDGRIVYTRKIHALDILLGDLKIKHQLIRAYTPRHNGKVERSHRTDQAMFYNKLTFKTYDELKKKMLQWNICYNAKPHASLLNKHGKKVWLTPLQKRAELEELLTEKVGEYKIRYIKKTCKRTIRQVYALKTSA